MSTTATSYPEQCTIQYTIIYSSTYHPLFWGLSSLFWGAGAALLLASPIDSLEFWAGIIDLAFLGIQLYLLIANWKKRPHCTFNEEGLLNIKTKQLYPWNQLQNITTVWGTICLQFSKNSFAISDILTREKKDQIIKLIKHYAQAANKAH